MLAFRQQMALLLKESHQFARHPAAARRPKLAVNGFGDDKAQNMSKPVVGAAGTNA
jgi:hypothetical protein